MRNYSFNEGRLLIIEVEMETLKKRFAKNRERREQEKSDSRKTLRSDVKIDWKRAASRKNEGLTVTPL